MAIATGRIAQTTHLLYTKLLSKKAFNMSIQEPLITELNAPELLKTALALPHTGYLKASSHYTYLKISDAYIHQLFPFIEDKKISKPDYFDKYSMGAHITVIYPEEDKTIHSQELNQEHHFRVINAFSTVIGAKRYYALKVEPPTLLELRRKHSLPGKLAFKKHWIDFHITFAVSSILTCNNQELII